MQAQLLAATEAEQLLALMNVPPGAARSSSAPLPSLQQPPQLPSSPYLIDKPAWWTVPSSASATLAWLKAHPPEGLRPTVSGSGGGPHGPFSYLGYAGRGRFNPPTLLIEVVPNGANASAIRVDGQTIWQPPRPVETLAPSAPSRVSVIAYQGSSAHVLARMTIRGANAAQLADLVNRLPVDTRGTHGCLMDSGLRYRVTFPAASGPLIFLDNPACSAVTVTAGGGQKAGLQDTAGLAGDLHHMLGA